MAHESPRPEGATRPADGSVPVEDTRVVPREAPAPQPAPSVDVDVVAPQPTGDQVRWGPVWAGLVVAVATFLLLEIILFALGVLTLAQGESGSSADLVTSIIALVAFFLGGLTAAATARWKGVDTGLLHGILVWALGLVVFLLVALIGGGALLGSVGRIATQFLSLGQISGNVPQIQVDQAISTARSTASWASLGLGLSLIASALGGVIGAKFWPRGRHRDDAEGSTHVGRG